MTADHVTQLDREPSKLFWQRVVCPDCQREHWRRAVAVFGGVTREVLWCECGRELHPNGEA